MIARSDRVAPLLTRIWGDEVASSCSHSGSTAPTIVWGAKAEPPAFSFPRRLCCDA